MGQEQHFRHNERERAPRTRRGHYQRTQNEAAQFERELDLKLTGLTRVLDGAPTMLNRALTSETFGHIPDRPNPMPTRPTMLRNSKGHFAGLPTLPAFLRRASEAFAHIRTQVRLK